MKPVKPDEEVGNSVAIRVTAYVGVTADLLVTKFSGGAREGVSANEAEGLVAAEGRVGVHQGEADMISVRLAEVLDLVAGR